MLVPAISRKEEILEMFKKYYYTTDMMYENGCIGNFLPNILEESYGDKFQYAVVGKDSNLIGYISYSVDWYASGAYNFVMFSFDRGNPVMGKDIFDILESCINEYNLHRIEWHMVSGNPIENHYDKFCKKHNGSKYILKDVFKDMHGNYHDSIIYEIIQ